MERAVDVFTEYPEYFPDIDNYIVPNCSYLDVEDLYPLICTLSLSILVVNIRSCKKNFDNFISSFSQCIESFACLVFIETWLSEDIDIIFDIPGFYCHNIYRNHYGGGIKLYLKNCIQSKILSDFTVIEDTLEMLTVKLVFCDIKYILMCIYHPPTSCSIKNVDFVDSLTSYLQGVLNLKIPVIIAGDINLNLLNPNNHFFIDMFINNMYEHNAI